MKKFKRIFYPIYLVVIVLVLIISFNIYEALELFKVWGWFKYFSDLPYMGRDLMIFLCVLMIVEIVAENYQIQGQKGKIRSLEDKVMELKAKLYDKSEGEDPGLDEDEEEVDPDEEVKW